MKIIALALASATVVAASAEAQTYYYPAGSNGRPAYSDTWNGGSPYPPIGQTTTYYGQPQTYTQTQVYVTPRTYSAPRTYVGAQPFLAYEPSAMAPLVPLGCGWGINCTRSNNVHPGYYRGASVQYGHRYVEQPTYVTRYPSQAYVTQAVQGPPQSRCIVAILNNGGYGGAGCSSVKISPADIPHLRQKFSHYQPNTGYTLNLPSDSEYR